MIRTLNRTSGSLEQLLDTANAENVDLLLTSSPMLLQHLQEHQKLALLDSASRQPEAGAAFYPLNFSGGSGIRIWAIDQPFSARCAPSSATC